MTKICKHLRSGICLRVHHEIVMAPRPEPRAQWEILRVYLSPFEVSRREFRDQRTVEARSSHSAKTVSSHSAGEGDGNRRGQGKKAGPALPSPQRDLR